MGIWYQEQTFGSVPLTGGDVLTGRSEVSHPCLALRSLFLSHSRMFAKEVFWFNCSLLDYVIMAFEFFIRSFLSWSLGLRGTCFWSLMCLKSQAICITAPLLWFFDSSGECSDVQSSALCAFAAWDVFVVCFCTGHRSPLLLPSLQVVAKAGDCWPVHLENLCLLKAVQKIQYFMKDTVLSLRGDGWHCCNAPVSLQPLSPVARKKSYYYSSLIKRIFLTFCCICSFLMILTEVPGEDSS